METSRRNFLIGTLASLIPFLGRRNKNAKIYTPEPVPLVDINIADISAKDEHWIAPSFHEADLIAESIQKIGLQNPILVRVLPDGKYAVVCGFRRVIACMILRHKTIMAYVSKMDASLARDYQAHVNNQERKHDLYRHDRRRA